MTDTPGVTGSGAPRADADTDATELARLRDEVTALRARLAGRDRRASTLTGLRRLTAAVLVAVTAFALVASVVGLWAANTTFNTERWVATVGPLPQDPRIATAVADYATNEVFAVLDVEPRLRAVLPEQAAFLAGPLATQMRDYVEKMVLKVLSSEQFQRIWVEANRRAHQQAMAIIEGRSNVVVARTDRVDIDLLPLINEVLRELSSQLPTLFGRQLALPDLSTGQVPAGLRATVQNALGVSLPADFARFTVYDAGRLRAVQEAVLSFKRSLALLVGATVALLVLALLASPWRRRTLLQFGVWLVVAAVAVTATLRAARTQMLEQVPAGVYRDAVGAAVTAIAGPLRERGVQLIWIGVGLAVLTYLVGPGRIPTFLRRRSGLVARAARLRTGRGLRLVRSAGPGWLARHQDAVRVSGVVVAVLTVLLLSSWTALLVTAVVLAAFEAAVTVAGRTARLRTG